MRAERRPAAYVARRPPTEPGGTASHEMRARATYERVTEVIRAAGLLGVGISHAAEPYVTVSGFGAPPTRRAYDVLCVTGVELIPVEQWTGLGAAEPLSMLFGPHCRHDECSMTSCDHEADDAAAVAFGCREQAFCPYCGPGTPAWPRLAEEWKTWAAAAYGTADRQALELGTSAPTNVVETARLIEAYAAGPANPGPCRMVLRIMSLAAGGKTALDGRYLVAYDPTKPGRDPAGRSLTARIETTDDPAQALIVTSATEACEVWSRPSGRTRPDGQPDRPLTAYTVSVEPAPGPLS